MSTTQRPATRILVADDEPSVLEAYRQVLCAEKPSTGQSTMEDLRAKLFRTTSMPALTKPAQAARAIDAVFCPGAEAAVAAVRQACEQREPFTVAFLDMRMPPGPDGAWAAAQIRQLDAEIEIVICTAYSDVDPAEIARRVPPEDKLLYLQKPFHPYEVRQMAIALAEKRSSIERRIAQLTHFDPLTGLPNRARFLERLVLAVEEARSKETKLAVLYVDLDNFKRINDTLGFAVGDEFLCVAVERLRQALRADDDISRAGLSNVSREDAARLGGDEFIILLRDIAEPGDGAIVAERLLTSLAQPTRLALHEFSVTASIGVAHYEPNGAGGADAEALFRHAGLAMYAAKRQGGGRYAEFDASMSTGAQMRLSLEGRLHKALGKDELSLHYQPKFDLGTGLVSGLEALLRWTNPDLGTVSPMEFIPVAEETGLILPIGEWVLRTACSRVKAWSDAGLPAGRVAVNVSGLQFVQRDFPELVAKVLKETGLRPEQLEL
ncbi:MAG: putative bifunctional diguanylate cyclase/phosphodiesterase, partial [Steroidobacteraceae bacterium]